MDLQRSPSDKNVLLSVSDALKLHRLHHHPLPTSPSSSCATSTPSSTSTPSTPIPDIEDVASSQLLFIDIRSPEAYRREHIPGASHLYACFEFLASSDPEGHREFVSTFEKLFGQAGVSSENGDESEGEGGDEGIKVVFYDEDAPALSRAFRAWFMLTYLGHLQVHVLNGGIKAWKRYGGPVTSESTPSISKPFHVRLRNDFIASRDDVLKALQSESQTVLLDTRDAAEWFGERSASSTYPNDFVPRKGRLTNAKWLFYWDIFKLEDDGTHSIKPKDDIMAKIQALEIEPTADIICYCFKGSRAACVQHVLRFYGIGSRVRNYFASWNEWARDSTLPIDEQTIPKS